MAQCSCAPAVLLALQEVEKQYKEGTVKHVIVEVLKAVQPEALTAQGEHTAHNRTHCCRTLYHVFAMWLYDVCATELLHLCGSCVHIVISLSSTACSHCGQGQGAGAAGV